VLMERATFSNMDCPIARAAEEVGEALKGALTFSDFESRLPIAPNTLTRRLDVLCSRGLLERATYQTNPPRDQYVLTEKALDLLPVLIALGEWGNRWLAPEGELLTVIDAQSGRAMDVAVVDRRTSRPLRAGSVAIKAGPGARRPVREGAWCRYAARRENKTNKEQRPWASGTEKWQSSPAALAA
jgi:DNA-binding HxlR family transcriptional regulator